MPSIHPAHLSLALRVYADLPAIRCCPGPALQPSTVRLHVSTVRSLESGEVQGYAEHAVDGAHGGSIEIIHHPDAHAATVLVVLLHEVVHLALPERELHGPLFRATFAAAAEEAWGIDLGDELDEDGPGEGYEWLQQVIEYRLRERTIGLRLRLWWVGARRWLGVLGAQDGLDVGLADHLLLMATTILRLEKHRVHAQHP